MPTARCCITDGAMGRLQGLITVTSTKIEFFSDTDSRTSIVDRPPEYEQHSAENRAYLSTGNVIIEIPLAKIEGRSRGAQGVAR
jgi:hypothetical protein